MKPCKICYQPGAGNHFGVHSCRACAAFFRRGALRKFLYNCKNKLQNEKCEIFNPKTKEYICKRCRMNKCLAMGMNVNRFQFGRDYIGPPECKKASKNEINGPKYIYLECGKSKMNYIELKFLLEEAENILQNQKPKPTTSSTLLRLSHASNSVRDLPNPHTFKLYTKWGANEKLKDWETSFLTVTKWFTYFAEFQQLPMPTRMKILPGTWHLWVLFDKLYMNFIARKNGFASNRNILIAGYNTYLDLRNVRVKMGDFSKIEDE